MSFPTLRDTRDKMALPTFHRKFSHQPTTPVLPPEKLYLLLPNHQCPNPKNCPFHPPEEQEGQPEEGPELSAPVNKKRALSLASWEDSGASEKLLAEKLAKINQQISSRLEDGHKLHLPRKTSQDISTSDLSVRSELSISTETIVGAASSTREHSVASDYESSLTLDSGVTFDSCSDREMEEDEPLPLIQEEVVVPDVVVPEELQLKNGEPLVEDVNHKASIQEGEATLQIHVLSTEDEGTYTCQAVNSHGEAETSAELTVEEVRHRRKRMEDEEASVRYIRPLTQYDTSVKDTNIAPEFTLPLVDQSRGVGEEVTFTVTVTCRPEPDVTWYHGNEEMVRSSRVSFQHDKGVYRMTVLDLNVKDAGEWRCKAVNSYGEAWCSCDLKVLDQVPAGHSRPRFTKELEYMTVTQGSLVRLECSVVGEPAPEIKWFKDRLRVDVSDRHYKIRHYADGKVTTATLVIEGSEVEDGGMYMCVAENSAGSASSEAKIRVQKVYDHRPDRDSTEPLEKRSRDESPMKKSRMEVPPDFTAKLKNKSAAEGATVRLNCSVTGIPEPMVRWFRDGKEIYDGHDYTMRNNYGLLSLEIVYAKKSLAGKYTVEASNNLGTVSTSCTLDVEGDEELDALEADFLRPKFLTKIQDIYVNEGADASFQCDATGKPMPAFKWQRDNITIVGSRRIVSEYDNQGHATLTLKEVKVTDAGLYYCIAQSRAGRSKCSAYLHVKAKSPSPTEPQAYRKAGAKETRSSRERSEGKGAPPSFALHLPSSVDVAVGQRLKLDCSVQGFPVPLVTWHKGDRELMYSQRHRIILCGTLHTMEIPQAMALDKGHYIVRATNVHGTVESSCFVNTLAAGEKVRTPPDYRRDAMREAARGNLQVETSSEEDEPEPPRKQAKAPFFIKHLPKTIDVMEGIDVRLDCILRRGIELIRWSSSRSPSQERDKERQLKKELKDAGFSGEFIPLETAADSSRPSADERKTEPADGRREHPSFLATPTDLVRPVGSEAVFECSTSGTPEPEVKWYKDGRVLISSDGVRMTSVGNKHKLKVKAILQSDEGQYTCKATSTAGSDSCSARLTIADDSSPRRPSTAQAVEEGETKASSARAAESKPKAGFGVPEKAVFSQGLPKNMSAGQGEEIELLCQLSSSAEVAGVRWELDGRQLPPEARYVISRDEDTHDQRLTLQSATPQDSGKYTCVVTFKDGDLIHSSTWLTVNAKEPTPPAKEEDFMPHFTSKLSDVTLKDGDELVLECDIQGNPRPQISWIRDGVEIFDSQDFQISMIGDHCKLQIADIYPEDEGKYSCKAVNALGEATTSCFVTVEELGGYQSRDSASSQSSRGDEKDYDNKPRFHFMSCQETDDLTGLMSVWPTRGLSLGLSLVSVGTTALAHVGADVTSFRYSPLWKPERVSGLVRFDTPGTLD
ncbi:hypothetical protein RRG08_034500 [Elysia crispata]|uniref:Ig-like domain-containing protein n=1 Tax=Elysia crispata TaxID=231223 RepID=A0AAE1BAC4_9GAST|nr:hypothetical protein RRG08_034500 [Elysia crispata]